MLLLAYLFLIVYFRVDMDDNYDAIRNSYLAEDNDDDNDDEIMDNDKLLSLDGANCAYPF